MYDVTYMIVFTTEMVSNLLSKKIEKWRPNREESGMNKRQCSESMRHLSGPGNTTRVGHILRAGPHQMA